jgi:hypothetical protein
LAVKKDGIPQTTYPVSGDNQSIDPGGLDLGCAVMGVWPEQKQVEAEVLVVRIPQEKSRYVKDRHTI